MTALRHHPHDETLMSYAAGNLDPALSLVLNCHLQFCAKCRKNLRLMEDVGGILLEEMQVQDDGAAFLERSRHHFAQLFAQKEGREATPLPLDAGNEVIMPSPLARATGLRRETIPWVPMEAGLNRFDLPPIRGAKAAAHIFNIGSGAFLPPAKHGGQLVLVLWGAYDYDGDRFTRGDLHDIDASSFETFAAASPEGVTYVTAISPVLQFEILRTAH